MKRQVYDERGRSLRSLLMVTASFLAVVIILVQLDRIIRPTIKAVCEEECRVFVSRLISGCIEETLSKNSHSYQDYAEIIYDENGQIAAVETLTGNVNSLQSKLLDCVNKALDESRDTEISVSLGTASGVWIFAGHGPQIPLRFLPIGNASVELISTLDSAGINQTCHTILIKVTVHAAAAIPFCKTETDATYEYLLAETVLVGSVPESYAVIGGK